MKKLFDRDQKLGQVLQEWWEGLEERRGDRAELRRAKTVTEVMLLPTFHRACVRFAPFFQYEGDDYWQSRLAAILGLLAHIRQDNPNQGLAVQMAGSPPEVSELRFRRLIQRDRADLYVSLIRILRMLGNKADLHDLANSVYYWGEQVKRDWAFDYFPNTPDTKSA
ncbi:MAG: type I-E CRISPR-associated protein Cse2/CasB [Proteobacteria bacterium]|nr:MAG: type I-E CRISPR-associated protein Cse2/CasB [Pseudomonadota bacterium]